MSRIQTIQIILKSYTGFYSTDLILTLATFSPLVTEIWQEMIF